MSEPIQVERRGEVFLAICPFERKDEVKAAGFRWDPGIKRWWTKDPEKVARLTDPEAAERFRREAEEIEAHKAATIALSRAAAADVEIPRPDGLEYLPYQRAGIAFALDRPSVLIGDDMGLGKTIQLIGIINADPTLKSILIICPASLKLNWQRELNKWLVRPLRVAIAGPRHWPHGYDVVIINYDILTKHKRNIHGRVWDLVGLDEAHYLKNPKAKRTIMVIGENKRGSEPVPGIQARRRVALTGTPIPNRPIEAWPIINYLDPTFSSGNFFYYAKDFCDAHHNGYGWDFSGASNLDKLQERLRSSIMVRRKKADVLTELPPKVRQIVELDDETGIAVAEAESYEEYERDVQDMRVAVELAKAEGADAYQKAVWRLREAARVAFESMSEIRRRTAVAKIPQVITHLSDALEADGHKVVVFAHHKDVVSGILGALRGAGVTAVSITGGTDMVDRQRAVDAFQSDPSVRVFVGNIQAAGVGLTLTAAAHVIFAELDWVPGNVTQAEDRCHRIGQRDSVLVQHLVIDGSIDSKMAKTLIEKQAIIDAALDDVRAEEDQAPVSTPEATAATAKLTRKQVEAEAPSITPKQIEAIHSGLRMLAGMDGDRARDLNGIGFSRIDVGIGHSLAECFRLTPRQAVLGLRLVRKYRRQLPAEILEASLGS